MFDQGWEEESGDVYFQKRRRNADTANLWLRGKFYKMMEEIALEMDTVTGALSFNRNDGSTLRVLDLCMAPGGYSRAILDVNPTASIDGISLSPDDGGHEMLLPFGAEDRRVSVLFTDITMLATEYGIDMEEIPKDHPDALNFTSLRPYPNQEYDLVLCDGQVLRAQIRESYRKRCEPARLMNAQLILGLQRIKPGGTLIILLHKLETWHSMMLIRSFCMFATVELFKPIKAHGIKSSFYMVAKDVRPHSAECKIALKRYKSFWHNETFRDGVGFDECDDADEGREEVETVLEEFGPKLAELGRGIWTIQADALEKAPFMQKQSGPKWRK